MADTLNEAIASVIGLQPKWTSGNSSDMQRRGELIRDRIPELLEPLAKQHGLRVKGSDGSGLKNRVPWIRIYDPRFSPKATDGWYVVFLFAADGSAVFLSLNQGTNKSTGAGEWVPRDPSFLAERVKEARAELARRGVRLDGLSEQIQLADTGLGEGYERGNVYAIRYPSSALPPDSTIFADSSSLLELLRLLYSAEARPDGTPAAYLLAWNPKNWPWVNLPELAAQFRSGHPIDGKKEDSTWGVVNKAVKPGDRLFLIRLGKEPKGIMGSGFSASVPYEDAHYSAEPGKLAPHVNVKWDTLLDPERDKLLSLTELQREIPEAHWTPESSGISIDPASHSKLEQLWKAHLSSTSQGEYSISDAIQDVFLDIQFFEEICELARRRKNIVLQGPPGVGKTFIAKRIAHVLLGAKDRNRLEWVQFHQSYSYEDFIQGFRPSGTGFTLRPGIFYRFCEKAQTDNRTHVFVIDEINRGNLSRIFGEVLSLIEDDKRGDLSVALAYSDADDSNNMAKQLTIPPNVILLGLMNTADRSLAVVDYALRRRFAFVDLEPRFEDPKFDASLAERNISPEMRTRIKTRFKDLNSRICSDRRNLGRGFEIGHSFFCPRAKVQDEEKWFREVIRYEIKPLLMEYWFDDPEKAIREVNRLLGENTD